jgi:hypothetical protein
MKFTLKKIGGGFHPIVKLKVNGKKTTALIDTGANITVAKKTQRIRFRFGGKTFAGIVRKYNLPYAHYDLIIGNDVLLETGVIINYQKKEILFKK